MRFDPDTMRTPAAFQPHEAAWVEIFHEAMEAVAGLGFNLDLRSIAGRAGKRFPI